MNEFVNKEIKCNNIRKTLCNSMQLFKDGYMVALYFNSALWPFYKVTLQLHVN